MIKRALTKKMIRKEINKMSSCKKNRFRNRNKKRRLKNLNVNEFKELSLLASLHFNDDYSFIKSILYIIK